MDSHARYFQKNGRFKSDRFCDRPLSRLISMIGKIQQNQSKDITTMKTRNHYNH
jgi:hypothetical protein